MTPEEKLSSAAVTGIDLGGFGSAEVLRLDALTIDPDYQRDVRHDLVNKIGREYDIVKAGPILVSERADGSLRVVDGQHRMLGAIQAGEEEIFANVIRGLSQRKEAELRLARNDRRSDTIYEKFRTRLVMGDEKAHAIVEVCRQQGARINLTPNTSSGINGIASLELLYDIDGTGVTLGRTLRCVGEAFADEDGKPRFTGDTASTSMMKAVTWFLAQHVDAGEVPWTPFVERLGAAGHADLKRKSVSHRAINGGAAWLNHYRGMVELWNFGRREDNKLRAKTIGSITQLGDRGVPGYAWSHHRDRSSSG